ncbi:COG3014 family protein [Oceanicoccus sp. KOV_DT_Chl]|uniref:COG3014 family protein n=1 Tax=Oceanicoccus sp. KOV_DT_Chl TaxID=1904639 RepID=UPI000C7A7654|nr:hypothetical protein [Oceanicoccus sp. KOV_DT_Chl]
MQVTPVARLLFGSLLTLCLVSGCVTQLRQQNSFVDSIRTQGLAQTQTNLEKIKSNERSMALHLLNLGTLKSLNGDYQSSNADLERAKQIINRLQASSITENVGAATINETLRSYTGTPSERVLLHLQKALNYLQLQQLDEARVEILQADVTMQQLAKADSLSGQLASAHFISGLIYELNSEFDNAMISYRRALAISDRQKQTVPLPLQDSLLQLSKSQDFKEEYQTYQRRFSHPADTLANGDRELFIIYTDGLISHKEQQRISVYSFQQQQNIALAVPVYPASLYYPQSLTVNIAGKNYRTEMIENIETLARQDLNQAMPAITAAAMTRMLAKYQVTHDVQKSQGELAGLLVNIAGSLSERADLRSWNMLPSSIQVARVIIPASVSINDIQWPPELNQPTVLRFSEGKKLLLIASSLQRYAKSSAP